VELAPAYCRFGNGTIVTGAELKVAGRNDKDVGADTLAMDPFQLSL
jgi:hypothetical protein